MQQLPRVCIISGHDDKQVEFVCIYNGCTQSRFICSKCLKIGMHKHQQNDNNHILDQNEFQDMINDKLRQQKWGKHPKINKEDKMKLKQILVEIKENLNQLRNIYEQIEQDLNNFQISQLVTKLNYEGFNQFNDTQLNLLIDFDYKDVDLLGQISQLSTQIINNGTILSQMIDSLQADNQEKLQQKIRDCQYQIITYDQGDFLISSSTISNDLKYVASGGGDQKLKIWSYDSNTLINTILMDHSIKRIKFTDDSKILYVGAQQYLFQFDVENGIKETYRQAIHYESINYIYCITNTIVLTSSTDKSIIKTDVNLRQQIFQIQAHNNRIDGLDYNQNLNMIVSGSNDKSIKLWDANNGKLVLEKQNAHNNNKFIKQVLFIIKNNLLISLDNLRNIIFWNINLNLKQLEQLQVIRNQNNEILNISLVLEQQYITMICPKHIRIYSIQGKKIRKINHQVWELITFNSVQLPSMQAIVIKGKRIILCKIRIIINLQIIFELIQIIIQTMFSKFQYFSKFQNTLKIYNPKTLQNHILSFFKQV